MIHASKLQTCCCWGRLCWPFTCLVSLPLLLCVTCPPSPPPPPPQKKRVWGGGEFALGRVCSHMGFYSEPSVQFSSRLYLCVQKSPHTHSTPVSQNFSHCPGYGSSVCQINEPCLGPPNSSRCIRAATISEMTQCCWQTVNIGLTNFTVKRRKGRFHCLCKAGAWQCLILQAWLCRAIVWRKRPRSTCPCQHSAMWYQPWWMPRPHTYRTETPSWLGSCKVCTEGLSVRLSYWQCLLLASPGTMMNTVLFWGEGVGGGGGIGVRVMLGKGASCSGYMKRKFWINDWHIKVTFLLKRCPGVCVQFLSFWGEYFLFICLEGREVGLRQFICDEEGARVLVCVQLCVVMCGQQWMHAWHPDPSMYLCEPCQCLWWWLTGGSTVCSRLAGWKQQNHHGGQHRSGQLQLWWDAHNSQVISSFHERCGQFIPVQSVQFHHIDLEDWHFQCTLDYLSVSTKLTWTVGSLMRMCDLHACRRPRFTVSSISQRTVL